MVVNSEQAGERVIEKPSDLTASWLTETIGAGPVAEFATERIGTGQMSECYRVRLRYADSDSGAQRPDSGVLKVAATDPVSRQTGLAPGVYEREVPFYGDIAPGLGGPSGPVPGGPSAPCCPAAADGSTGAFDLLLGDAGPADVGDEIPGATIEQAILGVVELGRLHGPLLGDAALAQAPWLNRESPLNQAMITPLYAGFVDRYGDQISPDHRMVCERLVSAFDSYVVSESESGRVQGLVHGDYRLDNMLFGTAGADRPLTVVDWQTVSRGPGPGPRPPPPRKCAVGPRGCPPAADSGRLADRLLGPGSDRPVLLLGRLAARRRPTCPLRRAAARLPRCAGPSGAHRPCRGRPGCTPPKLFRSDDGDRVVDARRAHRARRPDVHDDAATALRPCARHRRPGDAIRRAAARGVAAFTRRRERARRHRRTAVERELVCRLRRCGTGFGRLVPHRPDCQRAARLVSRAAVRT